MVWLDGSLSQFCLNGETDRIAFGSLAGNVPTLKLKEPTAAAKITYLKEVAWNQDYLLNSANGIGMHTVRAHAGRGDDAESVHVVAAGFLREPDESFTKFAQLDLGLMKRMRREIEAGTFAAFRRDFVAGHRRNAES